MRMMLRKWSESVRIWRPGSSSHWFMLSKNFSSLNIFNSRENFMMRTKRVRRVLLAADVLIWNACRMCAVGIAVTKSIHAQPLR